MYFQCKKIFGSSQNIQNLINFHELLLLHLLNMFFLFIPQFDYVPDASMIQRRGTSAMPLVSFNTATFHGVHKTLEMKQCLDPYLHYQFFLLRKR